MKSRVLHALTAGLLCVPALASADGGIVTDASGPVTVVHGSDQLPASVGATLKSGDTLATGDSGKAQVRFDDNSVFVFPRKSEFHVDTFAMPHQGQPGSATYSLVQGGMRTVTGSVGKGKGDTYVVHAGGTTIKVQGSAYLALICSGNCGGFKDGLYVKGQTGVITVGNTKGSIQLRTGQNAYVASAHAPASTKASPFDDPTISADFKLDVNVETQVSPPKIEPEKPASP